MLKNLKFTTRGALSIALALATIQSVATAQESAAVDRATGRDTSVEGTPNETASPTYTGDRAGYTTTVDAKGYKSYTKMEEEAKVDPVSGSLNLDVNTHFISYGLDVWAAGAAWDDALFNPSFELNIALGGGFTFIIGTWWDVNDNAVSSIGGRGIQEVDVYGGLGYTVGLVSFTALYQEWMYGGGSERIVDFIVAVDTFLNPSLTIHGRVDGDDLGLEEGIVGVVGIEEGFDAGPVSISFPAAVAFATDNYHGGDGGFAYASLGVNASVPLTFLPGDWSLHAGVTGYYTNDEVIPSNPDETFITGNAGLTLAF